MAKVNIYLIVVLDILVNIKMIKKMDMVFIYPKNEKLWKANGLMVNINIILN